MQEACSPEHQPILLDPFVTANGNPHSIRVGIGADHHVAAKLLRKFDAKR